MGFLIKFSRKGIEWGSEQRSSGAMSGFRSPAEWFSALIGNKSSAGINVTQHTSLSLSAVYRAVSNLADDIAKLPIHLYQNVNGRRERVTNNRSLYLLNQAPNEMMNPYELKAALIACAALWGNGYGIINRDEDYRADSIDIYHPSEVTVQKVGRQLFYFVSGLGTFSADDVIHIKGLSFNGQVGISVVRYAAESMGVSLAAQKFGGSFFGNGANLGMVFTAPNAVSDKAYARLQDSIKKNKSGLDNANKAEILEEGMTVQRIGVPPNEAQFLETREFGIEEIARWFRMPPHMLQHMTRATHSNVEQMNMEYVTYTLMTWVRKMEEEFDRKLLTTAEQNSGYYFNINVTALLRGDMKARSEYYKALFGIVYTSNEIRQLEEMAPLDGGDMLMVPLNYIPADKAADYHTAKTSFRDDKG